MDFSYILNIPLLMEEANKDRNFKAQYAMGVIYEQGNGGAGKDLTKAVEWYRKAAASGYKEAQERLKGLGDGTTMLG